MAIPNKQIGWSQESSLLWEITRQMDKLTKVVSASASTPPPYKVYTALLSQSGGDNPQSISSGAVTQGVTYFIDGADSFSDFSNVGGPAIGTGDGTYFVATNSNIPNDYGAANLLYNTGAPVATVLENTIGNIWFIYVSDGMYKLNFNETFDVFKIYCQGHSRTSEDGTNFRVTTLEPGGSYVVIISAIPTDEFVGNDLLNFTPIEIRIYN